MPLSLPATVPARSLSQNRHSCRALAAGCPALSPPSPFPEVIARIEENGGIVLDKDNATMDQLAGVALAVENGFRKIAVTVALPGDAAVIRKVHPSTLIFGVHVTGLSKEEAEILVGASDLVTSCASKTIRDAVSERALRPGRRCNPDLCHDPCGQGTDHREDPAEKRTCPRQAYKTSLPFRPAARTAGLIPLIFYLITKNIIIVAEQQSLPLPLRTALSMIHCSLC